MPCGLLPTVIGVPGVLVVTVIGITELLPEFVTKAVVPVVGIDVGDGVGVGTGVGVAVGSGVGVGTGVGVGVGTGVGDGVGVGVGVGVGIGVGAGVGMGVVVQEMVIWPLPELVNCPGTPGVVAPLITDGAT